MNPQSPEFLYICDAPQNVPGQLNHIRLGVKDLFQVAGLPTTAGNPDWLKSHDLPEVTAPCVTALLEAGATLIGKTLTDELAYSLEGINLHYGTPINPSAPHRLPGGSSSGSAVAVANGSIDLGLGTDTGGSIRVPASYNGIYGFRPSHGAVSCEHLIPLSPRFDTVGWLAKDFKIIKQAGNILLPSPANHKLSHLVVANLPGIDLWNRSYQKLLDTWSLHFDSIQFIELTNQFLADASQAFRILQGREIWRIHGEWITQQQPNFADPICDRFIWCSGLTLEDKKDAEIAAQKFSNFWQTNVLPSINHVLLMPTTPGAAPLLNTPARKLEAYRNSLMGLTAPAGLTRAPQISLPYLTDQQSPWGISLLGVHGCDMALLDCASKLEP